MMDLKTVFPESFFDEEIRCGYKVTSAMKKVWAVQLDLLAEAMRVMDKHSIRYFAIGGTLLGAVRHNGYIPWDDDIDIAIPRKDYDRFREIAREEFSHPYFYQDEFNSPGLLCGHAKLRNSETTMVFSNHLKSQVGDLSFNMGIFIDFFPVDNLPDDSEKANKWWRDIRHVGRTAWHLRFFTNRGISEKVMGDSKIKLIFQRILLSLIGDPDYYFKKYNRLLSKYSTTPTSKSCLYCLFCKDKTGKNRWVWDRVCLDTDKLVLFPFEFLRIPCPSGYDAVLTQTYGDWHKMIQLNSEHGSVMDSFYDVDKPYTSYFNENGYLERSLVRKAKAEKK